MFSVSSITMIVVIAFLIVCKKLYEVVKHYQRPPHFPPGPSQVQIEIEIQFYCFISYNHSNPEQEKWRNLRINHFLGAYLGKYTFTSKNISQQKRFTHASHLQVYGRYIWPTIRVIPRTKTNCNRVWCKAIEGYLQTRLRKQFLEDRYKSIVINFVL